MPFSPSRKVMELWTEAVFKKAGSRLTRPVWARRLEMSMPLSPSLPTMMGSSSSCLPATMRTVSDTVISLREA